MKQDARREGNIQSIFKYIGEYLFATYIEILTIEHLFMDNVFQDPTFPQL